MFRRALTFDDVLLIPRYSEVVPSEVSTETTLVKGIKLNVPFISAAMDTVTECEMAKAMAHAGGIGIIHKNMDIEAQVYEVEKVKKSENGIITNPVTISAESTIETALKMMKDYKIGGLPVVDDSKRLLGLITNRDIRFETDHRKRVKELMTPFEKLITAGVDIDLKKAKEILHNNRIEKLPIIDNKGFLIGLITIKDIVSIFKYPLATKDQKGRLRVGAAIGTRNTIERAEALINADVDLLVIDSAHGHSKNIIQAIKKVKSKFPDIPLVAGNIATSEAAYDLIEAGVDAVKVGIGPGSICTTRVIAGIGVPQLTAIIDVAKITKKYNIPLIADGGIRYSGDIVKAIAAGADTVMMGSIFAGTDEAPGEVIIYQGRKYKTYRGMGSIGAMKKGSKDRYFQEDINEVEKLVPEGVEGMVAYKGKVEEVIQQLVGGLKAGMGYVGAKNISELKEKAEFIEITSASVKESHPHDIVITKESPNYFIGGR